MRYLLALTVASLSLLVACGDIAVTELEVTTPLGFPSDPIAYYTFDGDLKDSSGLGKHFETYPDGAFVADRGGFANAAYDLDVEDTDGLSPTLRAPHVPFSRDFTIALWLKGVPGTGSFWRIAGQGDWFSLGFLPNGEVSFGRDFTGSSSDPRVSDVASADDTWTFYAGVVRFDTDAAASHLSLHRSGVEVGSVVVDGIAYNNPGGCSFFVGMEPVANGTCSGIASGFRIPVQVDDVRVFDRALSEAELKFLAEEVAAK